MTEFSIYQINVDRDTANVCFIGMESLEKIKGTKDVNAAAYDRVYDGKMDCISLENIYQKFNVDHPADYKGRSLSVSDVVEIRESDTLNPGFYFVDSIGFKSISFDKSLCKEPVEAGSGKISVLLVEPNKYPKMIEIQPQLVDGEIERHQLGEGRVRRGEAALQLPVKRQIQTGEERPLLQGLLVIVARGIVGLGGDERKGHRTAAAGQRAAVAAASGRGYGAGRCRRRRFFGIQRVFLLLTSSSGGAAAAHASV